MRTLIIKTIACCAALLPFTQVQAAPAGKKLYGDFGAGKKFSFTVTDVTVAKASLTGGTVKAKVPSGVPNFKKGQKVKFTIGGKGQLTGPGFSIPFVSGSGVSNAYADKVKKGSTQLPDIGIVYKNGTTLRPEGVALTFLKVTGSGFSTTTYSVNYTLE